MAEIDNFDTQLFNLLIREIYKYYVFNNIWFYLCFILIRLFSSWIF